MAQGLITKSILDGIADAIRTKLGVQTEYKPGQMAAAISSIPVPNLQSKSVTPSASQQTIQPDSGYNGLSVVTVNGDSDLVSGNVKKDVVIFGVTGSYEGVAPTLQSKTVTPGASQQTVQPDSGYDGLSSVVVNGDADLVAGNIKKNVDIFGVTGSYEGSGGGSTLITKSITQNGTYNASSDNADGYSQVTVNVSGGPETVKLKVGPTFTQVFDFPVTEEYGPMVNGGATQFFVPVKSDGTEAKVDLSLPFEICCTFMLTNDPSANTGRNVFGAIGSYWECPAIAAYNGKFAYFFTTRSSTWTHNAITITPSGYSTPLNTWIVAKIIYDGTKYVFSIDDGTVQASQELTGVTTYYNSNYRFCFGSQSNSTTYAIAQTGAKIKIAGTYLKQNGVLIWGEEAA